MKGPNAPLRLGQEGKPNLWWKFWRATGRGWLPDMDLNHDKQIQSLLCYRYTIGHPGGEGRLGQRA